MAASPGMQIVSKSAIKMIMLLVVAGPAGALPLAAQQMDAPPGIQDQPGSAKSKKPDIEKGKILARKLCASCHLTGEPANAPVPSDVPTFAGIANSPGQTIDHLSTWLTRPHPPMPNLNLTRMEIRDLAGYILSLRSDK